MNKKPNILFIIIDQQHAGMMSCTGNQYLKTPAMDSLARDGIHFEKAYCTNPVCAPSRISMVTGMMSCRLGADDNALCSKIDDLPMEVVENSMGNLMKRAGYDTFYGGKVHLCSQLNPLNAGYDEFFRNDREELPEACLDFICKERRNPFFSVASFINPHDICFSHWAKNGKNHMGVLELRERALALPMDELPSLPDNYAITQDEASAIEANLDPAAITPAITMRKEYDDNEWRINRWIYHRLTEQVDALIGQILLGLKEAELENDTLVIFTSDHGNMDASHHLASKGLPYEESVGVPLILRYPGSIPIRQTDSDHLISTGLDILPTLCDYAGLKKPTHLLGKSLRPLAENQAGADCHSYVVSENDWFRMLRTNQYKYCCFAAEYDEELLFDLESDLGELNNLANDLKYQETLNNHRHMMSEWMTRSDDKKGKAFL